jgi:hypothetical protein
MERARATWTDERLDDLARRMEHGFDRIDRDLRGLSARVDAQGAELGARIDGLSAELSTRIDAMQRTMLQIGGGIIASVLLGVITLLATQG